MSHLYSNMKFDPYEFREYPKFVETGKDDKGKPVGITVYDEDEELQVLSKGEDFVREEDEKKRLIDTATVFGVQIDKRWSAAKISAAISEAGFDPAHNPYK